MKVYVTCPRVPQIPLNSQIDQYWQKYNVEYITNFPFEIHSELLTRVWNLIRYNLTDPDHLYIVSENDFIPDPNLETFLKQRLITENRRMVITPYFTRNSGMGVEDHWPLVNSGCFVALYLKNIKQWPPLTWLGAQGLGNDCNKSLSIAQDCGFITPDKVFCPDYTDLIDSHSCVGMYFHDLGYHVYFARHFPDDPETVLIHPLYKLSQHLEGITNILSDAAAQWKSKKS